jgi:hypothetical protein
MKKLALVLLLVGMVFMLAAATTGFACRYDSHKVVMGITIVKMSVTYLCSIPDNSTGITPPHIEYFMTRSVQLPKEYIP